MLEHYAGRLNAVELNGSFYRTPPPATLEGWAARTPPGFRFCLKGHRGLTYSAAAFDKVGLARELGRKIGALGERAGPMLVQFPPTRALDPGLLDAILEALAVPAAVEFRDPGWFDPAVFAVLARRGAALVVTDQEKWPLAPEMEGPVAYFRLRRDYDEAGLEAWARRIQEQARRRQAVYVFFKHEPEAPERALAVMGRTSSDQPGRR
jgi:uncharacterized protein YecE (DUF72 family)